MAIDTDSLTTSVAAPPRSRAGSKATGTVKAQPATSTNATRKDIVEGTLNLFGMGALMFGQFADTKAITMHSPNIGQAAADMADKDEKVASAIDYLQNVGPWAALVSAVLPLGLQIAVNHKILPSGAFQGAGVVDPQVLDSQMRAEILKQQTAALKAQQAAQSEYEEAVRDMQIAAQAQVQAHQGQQEQDAA